MSIINYGYQRKKLPFHPTLVIRIGPKIFHCCDQRLLGFQPYQDQTRENVPVQSDAGVPRPSDSNKTGFRYATFVIN